jgi:amidase
MFIKHQNAVTTMSPDNHAKGNCSSGSIVIFQTQDCYGGKIKDDNDLFQIADHTEINPATGPLYIYGAAHGDILKIDILNIALGAQGCMALLPGHGPLGKFIKKEKTKTFKIKNGHVEFNKMFKIPVSPMIGVIGTSPKDASISTGTPGEHGGNMDCKKIRNDTTLYLQVNVDGALLSIGDLHAVMGDGETATCAVETAGEATVRVTVLKNIKIPTPLLRTEDEYVTISSAKTLDKACEAASKKMLDLLGVATDMDVNERIMLLSLVGSMEICQVVNPLKTARTTIPSWILEQYNFALP